MCDLGKKVFVDAHFQFHKVREEVVRRQLSLFMLII
jgi:hypothetical protein